MDYHIHCNDYEIGSASIDKQGLFYCAQCCCRDENTVPYRVYIDGENGQVDMGICPPSGKITVRFPVKKVGEGKLRFFAVVQKKDTFAWCVQEDSQFPFLTKLPQAYLRQCEENSYIDFKYPEQGLQDNDRSL